MSKSSCHKSYYLFEKWTEEKNEIWYTRTTRTKLCSGHEKRSGNII
jgi:hypothetical protein